MKSDDILAKIDDCESIDEQIEVCTDYLPQAADPLAAKNVLPVVIENLASEDIDDIYVGVYLGTLADTKGVSFNKTQLKTLYNNKVEEQVDSIGTEEKIPLDEWLVEHVESVTKQITTDSDVDVTYVFNFKNDQTIETVEEHYSFSTLSKLIYKQFDVSTSDPSETSNDGWADWIEEFIRERKTEKEFTGPRTQVIEEIQSRITGSDAFTDLELAFNRKRIHYDEDEGVYNIPSHLITSVCEDYGIKPKALQVELDKKGYIDGGVSHVEWINGQSARFWQLDADFADANIVREEDSEFDNSRYESDSDE